MTFKEKAKLFVSEMWNDGVGNGVAVLIAFACTTVLVCASLALGALFGIVGVLAPFLALLCFFAYFPVKEAWDKVSYESNRQRAVKEIRNQLSTEAKSVLDEALSSRYPLSVLYGRMDTDFSKLSQEEQSAILDALFM